MRFQLRSGVTLVEVLTSIVVAVIGVAGVLVLIPFGVRQAKIGLDLDSSTTVAENAVAMFEVSGYGQFSFCGGDECLPWIDATATPSSLLSRDGNVASCYWIDPYAPDMLNFQAIGSLDIGVFNAGDTSSGGVPYRPRVTRLMDFTSAAATPTAIGNALANRLFQTTDDVEFAFETSQDGNIIDELSPPQPILDIDPSLADTMDNDGDGAIDETDELAVRRQSLGSVSWSAVAVPRRNLGNVNLGAVEGFDFHVLVYRDRDTTSQMPLALVTAGPTTINGVGTVTLGADISIENDQWIMLVNFVGTATSQPQVGFFRVIGSDETNDRITIDGPTFSLPAGQNTYAIALPGVVNVYKRQIELEATSSFSSQ